MTEFISPTFNVIYTSCISGKSNEKSPILCLSVFFFCMSLCALAAETFNMRLDLSFGEGIVVVFVVFFFLFFVCLI